MTAKEKQHKAWQDALVSACVAGTQAARATTPTPMIVGTPRDLMGSLMGTGGGGFDPEEPTYFVSGGVCGFAWIQVSKDRAFMNWLRGKVASKHPAAAVLGDYRSEISEPRPDSYLGGIAISVFGYGQSMTLKAAFAGAFARKLSELVPSATIYSQSRMD